MAIITGTNDNDTLIGGIEDDVISGLGGDDELRGNQGNDTLDGGVGADTMRGGPDNDTYVVDNSSDVVVESPGEGVDLVKSSISYALFANTENLTLTGSANINGAGNDLDNIIIGNVGSNVLAGGAGNDTYGVNSVSDIVVEEVDAGIDTVSSLFSYTLGDNVENLDLTGGFGIIAVGNALANSITGNVDSNLIDGGPGGDTMVGGFGNDTYIVDDASDVVVEAASQGKDEVRTQVSYVLAANVENLTLLGTIGISGSGNELDNEFMGNSAPNTLDGLAGNDTLNGGAGADIMRGGLGDDSYIIDNSFDVVIENPNEGVDLVSSSVSYTLSTNIESVVLTGSASIDATGNDIDNVLTGNDRTFSGLGDNTLTGGAGDDLLDGRTGFDALMGEAGDDTYIIKDSMGGATSLTLWGEPGNFIVDGQVHSFNTDTGLFVAEMSDSNQDGLIDWVSFGYGEPPSPDRYRSTLSFSTSRLGTNLSPGTYLDAERASFASPGHPGLDVDFDHRGSSRVYGSFTVLAADFDYSGPEPVLQSFAVTFEQHSESPIAPALFGTLNYKYLPADPLVRDSVVEDAGDGIDTVISSLAAYTLPANVENLTLTGTANINGAGNDLDNLITGNSGNNVLDGGTGFDTLSGGARNDTYIISDTSTDSVIENPNEGTDTVMSAHRYTMPENVENLTLTAGEDVDGIGNQMNNIITGNSGDNSVMGRSGNDILLGGPGNDILDGETDGDMLAGGTGDDIYVISGTASLSNLCSIELQSDPGNFIGSGQAYSFNSNTGTFFTPIMFDLDHNGKIDFVRFSYSDYTWPSGHSFTFDFSTSQLGADFAPGIYLNAQRATFASPGHPGLDVYGDGRGSNTVFGNFTVFVAEFDYSEVTPVLKNLSVKFEQHSGNPVAPALFGTFNYTNALLGTSLPDAVIESPGEGSDTVLSAITYTLPTNVENLTLTGNSAINATGNALGNVLMGNSLSNTLTGDAGADTLEGGGGSDTANGGTGNDFYVFNSGFGHDLIIDDDATAGNLDTVSFGTGITTSAVTVTRVGDDLKLTVGAGADAVTVQGWFASDAQKVERVQFADGTVWDVATLAAMSGGGQTITGTVDNDVLTGGPGNDTIDGLAGADTMSGLAGDDTYFVDSAGDVVSEAANAGTDTVKSAITYTLGANVENLTLIGTVAINGTGNSLNNTVIGNSAGNMLNGGLGSDIMAGGAGNDVYTVNNVADTIIENAGEGTADRVNSSVTYSLLPYNNVENLTLTGTGAINGTGNALDNAIIGNTGANVLTGGAGNDTYTIGAGDSVVELAAEGADLVNSSVTVASLWANVENLTLTGSGAINGTGNTLANTITGNSGVNVLTGREGDDTYVFGAGDSVVEVAGEGIDTVKSSVTVTSLWANVENLILTGTGAINGTGNGLANTITGNSGANQLNGLAGADTLIGGGGNDTYTVDEIGDVVTENASAGTDTINSPFTYVLPDHVENLTLTGIDNTDAMGNSANNTLRGNTGNNVLDGGAGNDTLIGGLGDDGYVIDSATDVITETANQGFDTINSSVTRTVSANVEKLVLTGISAINGTGNTANDYIVGNSANNTLKGNAGNDLLNGGAGTGVDTLIGDGGFDVLEGMDGNDTLSDTGGNNLFNGGAGNDTLTGNTGKELFIGGAGNDTVSTGTGADIIAFNRGDGQDTVNASTGGPDNALSIGGGIGYADLSFTRTGNNLVLNLGGAAEKLTLVNWYLAAPANKSVINLQVIAEAMVDFDANSSDPLLNRKVQTFDFAGLVGAFDAAGAPNNWALMDALLSEHLGGTDTEALGGDLAYRYGLGGSLANVGFDPAVSILSNASFGSAPQALQPLQDLQQGIKRLS